MRDAFHPLRVRARVPRSTLVDVGLDVGLGLAMLATLWLEIVDGRLLSAVTGSHVSFVAISVATLGAAAGAGRSSSRQRVSRSTTAPASSPRWAAPFAMVLPLSHLFSLDIPMPDGQPWTLVRALVAMAANVRGNAVRVMYAVPDRVVTLRETDGGRFLTH